MADWEWGPWHYPGSHMRKRLRTSEQGRRLGEETVVILEEKKFILDFMFLIIPNVSLKTNVGRYED